MFENLKQFFRQLSDTSAMANTEQVRANIPADAVYVTLSTTLVVETSSRLMSLDHHSNIPVTALADGESSPMLTTYMIHDGQNLLLIRDGRTMFTTPLTDIALLHRFANGGFVLHLKDGRGIATSTPTPVKKDSNMQFRTIDGMTDLTGGWLKELESFGVRVSD